jgi:hypothetical protein
MGAETSTSVDEGRVQQFAASVRGRVHLPGDAGYDEARMVRNGLIDRRPALIVQCSGTADVVDAVDFAREQRLDVSIRGGAHNVAGNAVTTTASSSTSPRCEACTSTPNTARRRCRAVRRGATSIVRHSSGGSPRPEAR